jgi:hypothetical protein
MAIIRHIAVITVHPGGATRTHGGCTPLGGARSAVNTVARAGLATATNLGPLSHPPTRRTGYMGDAV